MSDSKGTPMTDGEYLIYMAGLVRGSVGYTMEGRAHADRLELIAKRFAPVVSDTPRTDALILRHTEESRAQTSRPIHQVKELIDLTHTLERENADLLALLCEVWADPMSAAGKDMAPGAPPSLLERIGAAIAKAEK